MNAIYAGTAQMESWFLCPKRRNRQQAEQERQHAEQEHRQAERERLRAERLEGYLRSQGIDPDNLPDP
jgi:hypothetical protein